MKNFKFLLLLLSLIIVTSLFSQEKFSVPQLTQEQKQEVLYSHVMAYCVSGINIAKNKGVSPLDYGKFTGKLFSAYWDPAGGFPVYVNRIMYILAGMHPDNQMQIVNQSANSITFKLKNVDYSFKNGPMFGVSYQDVMDFSEGILTVVADYMKSDFKAVMDNDGWYVVTITAK